MRRYLLPVALLALCYSATAQTPWINEFHYDNVGTDVGEFIEVAGDSGLVLTGHSLVLYDGATGLVYDTNPLSGTIPDIRMGVGVLAFSYPTDGIQNDPGGIALVDPSGVVKHFISYEGSFTAMDGPAAGMVSYDEGVFESDLTPIGGSVALLTAFPLLSKADCPYGGEANEYYWDAGFFPESPGSENVGQLLCAVSLPLEIVSFTVTPSGRDMQISWSTASENGLSHFDVERSLDGVNFVVEGQVEATGFETGNDYEFVLGDLMVRTNYFRISQINLDGTVDRTEVLRHDFEILGAPEVYPTVSSDFVQIDFLSEYDGIDKQVRVFNLLGQEVYSRTTSDAVMSLDVSGYSEGRYFVQVLAGQDVFVRSIVRR